MVRADTVNGRIEGSTLESGVHVFRGVPYGIAPTGARRFKPAAPVEPWDGVLPATSFGASCPPDSGILGESPESTYSGGDPGGYRLDEDCLVLNVWTPAVDDGRARPVMVCFHGGAWHAGNAGPGFDGTNLARRQDVVVVGVNHRLHLYGFLYLREHFGDEYAASGNVGMLDLAAALEWVRDNIAAFGGDPGNVTVFGRSGGGAKVCHAMAMPAFAGLFRRAIIGSGHSLWRWISTRRATEVADVFLRAVGVAPSDVEALSALSTAQMQEGSLRVSDELRPDRGGGSLGWVNFDWFAPVVDGAHLPGHPFGILAAGSARDVDVMLGTEHHDHWNPRGIPDDPLGYPPDFGLMSWDALDRALRPLLGERTEPIIRTYRTGRPGSAPSTLLATILSDRDWRMPHIAIAEALEQGGRPAFMYANEQPSPVQMLALDNGPRSGSARALVGQVSDAWGGFARVGDPTHEGLPEWPRYTRHDRLTMVFDDDCRVVADPFSRERTAWDGDPIINIHAHTLEV